MKICASTSKNKHENANHDPTCDSNVSTAPLILFVTHDTSGICEFNLDPDFQDNLSHQAYTSELYLNNMSCEACTEPIVDYIWGGQEITSQIWQLHLPNLWCKQCNHVPTELTACMIILQKEIKACSKSRGQHLIFFTVDGCTHMITSLLLILSPSFMYSVQKWPTLQKNNAPKDVH